MNILQRSEEEKTRRMMRKRTRGEKVRVGENKIKQVKGEENVGVGKNK
jgi:hypothetical protein